MGLHCLVVGVVLVVYGIFGVPHCEGAFYISRDGVECRIGGEIGFIDFDELAVDSFLKVFAGGREWLVFFVVVFLTVEVFAEFGKTFAR